MPFERIYNSSCYSYMSLVVNCKDNLLEANPG